MVIKEEQPELPPGFTQEEEIMSRRVSPSAFTFYGGCQSDGSNPTELNSVAMQNSAEYLMRPICVNNNKRKADGSPIYQALQPPVLPPPAKASQSQSHSMMLNYNSIIVAIKAMHGDIDKDCNFKSDLMRKLTLLGICNVLNDLRKKQLDEIDFISLENYCDVVRDVEKTNVNVKWLLQGLDQIKDAIRSRDETKVLNEQKNELMKQIEEKSKELERLKNEVEQLEKDISTRTSKFQQFQCTSLMDGLIYHT